MKKKLISIILLLVLLTPLFSQEYYPFTEEEIINITEHIQELERADSINNEIINLYETQINSYTELIRLDSLEINYKDKEIILLKKMNENLKPGFYEKIDEYVGYVLGALTIIGSALIVREVNK